MKTLLILALVGFGLRNHFSKKAWLEMGVFFVMLSLNKMIFTNTLIRLINWASVNKIIIVIEGAMKKTKRASCLLLSCYISKGVCVDV